ncbi:MAG: YclG [candidate division CPR1 bacterium GW2011_GWA2_42_17]|uniref:YclG n=1 Tax=candidate division CPR1 bacterium GW2011_GWA2_42_17 TaxID=1618341 RepID=A0A0G0Z7L2_9BACT|nr:MAG: YclG [candidate division CPR1 bacterium GW2011_GWA2_42_17]
MNESRMMKINMTILAKIHSIAFVLLCVVLPCSPSVAEVPVWQPWVDASAFGYNAVDATTALQAAINSGARTVYVPNMGTPWIVTPIFLASNQEIIFESGVLIQAKAGSFIGQQDCLFKAEGKSNITLTGYGARFRMRKEDYLSLPGEWRMGIWLRSCTNVNIRGMRIENTGGDGVYIGEIPESSTPCQNITIKDVTCEDCARNAISVVSVVNLLIDNCILRTTSGLAPMCGIDFEPNYNTDKIVNCIVRYSIIEGNVDHGIALPLQQLTDPSGQTSGSITNCTIISNGSLYNAYGIYLSHYLPNWTIRDNLIVNNYGYGMYQNMAGLQTTVTYTAFYGNIGGITYHVTRGTGCLTTVAPLFASADISSSDYMYLAKVNVPAILLSGASNGGYLGARPMASDAQACANIWQFGKGMPADFNHDCVVNFLDVVMIANDWLVSNNPTP